MHMSRKTESMAVFKVSVGFYKIMFPVKRIEMIVCVKEI